MNDLQPNDIAMALLFAKALGGLFINHGVVIDGTEVCSRIISDIQDSKYLKLCMSQTPVLLHGRIKLKSNVCAQVAAFVHSDWNKNPPRIVCHEKWLHTEQDWHVYKTGELCYVIPDEWLDDLNDKILIHEKASLAKYAAEWCYDSISDLLNKHWIGFREQMTEWPAEWSAWKHGQAGVLQYRREKWRKLQMK